MIRFAPSRKFTFGAVSALAGAILVIGGTSVAEAATTQSVGHAAPVVVQPTPDSNVANCKASYPGDLCWWVDANQVGKMQPVRDAIGNWATKPDSYCPSGTWNDCASTLYNANTTTGAQVFENASGAVNPSGYCVQPGVLLDNLTDYSFDDDDHGMNDAISSNSWGSCAGF